MRNASRSRADISSNYQPPPPPPPPPPPKVIKVVKPPPSFIQHNQMVAPKVIPKKITIVKDQPLPQGAAYGSGVVGGVPGGSAGGALGGIIGGTGPAAPPPPPPKAPSILHVGGSVQSAKIVRMVQPVYPPIAKAARIQGTVVLHAIIAQDGTVQELKYVSGPPLLVQSAMDAVKQWRYQPTLLNGEPVKVDTVITVIFTLGG
jgi:protein TonB